MPRKIGPVLLVLITVLVLASPALAGKDTLATIGADPEKVAKKVWFGPAHADLKKIGDIGKPERMALLSLPRSSTLPGAVDVESQPSSTHGAGADVPVL